MALQHVEDITLGLGTLEVGSYDSNGNFVSYRDLGAIKAEGNIHIVRTAHPFETGRPLTTIKKETIQEMVEIQFTLAELTVANIKDVLGGGLTSSGVAPTFLDGTSNAPIGDPLSSSFVTVGASVQTFTFGGQCDVFTVALRFTHLKSCSTGKRQILEVYKGSPTGDLSLPFRETDWNLYQANWTALADLTKVAGKRYFQFIDEV